MKYIATGAGGRILKESVSSLWNFCRLSVLQYVVSLLLVVD
jgi:hypothetical protein